MKLRREVSGNGPLNAEIIIVGEAPGDEELEKGIPFVGPSGKLLRRKLLEAGISDTKVRFENVIERKLPGNRIDPLYLDSKKISPGDELVEWFRDIRKRLNALTNRKVIVACGDTALYALAGIDRPPRGKSLIGTYHCTPIDIELDAGREHTKLIPVYHPAYILRTYSAAPWLKLGLSKARRMANGESDQERSIEIVETLDRLRSLENTLEGVSEVSVDIEVLGGGLSCIGFGWFSESKYSGACVPLSVVGGSFWGEKEEEKVWISISRILGSAVPKLFQNFIFDVMYLSKFGMDVCGDVDDTMLVASVLHPELPKGLADLARVYTLAPTWKGLFDWGAVSDDEELYRYNAMDAVLTLEIAHQQRKEMADRKLLEFYERRVKRLIPSVRDMCERGWPVDREALEEIGERMERMCSSLSEQLQLLASKYLLDDFNPNSHVQVKELFGRMGMQIPTKDGKQTTGRLALLKMARKYPENAFIPLKLEYAKAAKLQSTYAKVRLDDDGRLRFSVNIAGTKSGRFSSSQTPWKTGLNSQNVPTRNPDDPFNFRHVLAAEEGCKLIQIDLKQAEARVVAWLAREEKMEELFDSGGDIHTQTASLIFGEDIRLLSPEVKKRKRYLGKKSVHSFNYGMAEGAFADSCLLEGGMSISIREAKELKASYFRAFPNVLGWHKSVQDTVRRKGRLVSPFGRERLFFGRLNDELFREAYSFLPQATVVDYLNEGWMEFEEEMPEAQVLQQGHDSIVVQVREEMLDRAIAVLSDCFHSVSFKVYGREHRIPYDIAVGDNWRDLEEIEI